MKKILSLFGALMAASSSAVAGGNIASIEGPVVVAKTVNTDAGFYLGLAYGALSHKRDNNTINDPRLRPFPDNFIDKTNNEMMLQAGYKFNPYIAVEGRYWYGFDDDLEGGIAAYLKEPANVNVDAWGIYLKPMYPVTEALDVYALLGYGSTKYDITTYHSGLKDSLDDSFDGFTWGLGASYAFTKNISIFADYIKLYDDDTDYTTLNGRALNFHDTIDIINIGLTYKF